MTRTVHITVIMPQDVASSVPVVAVIDALYKSNGGQNLVTYKEVDIEDVPSNTRTVVLRGWR